MLATWGCAREILVAEAASADGYFAFVFFSELFVVSGDFFSFVFIAHLICMMNALYGRSFANSSKLSSASWPYS